MTTLPLADARSRLSEIVADAQATHKRYEITRNGRSAAVLLAAEDYHAMQETIAVLADGELLESIQIGLAELADGNYLNQAGLADYLRRIGRG